LGVDAYENVARAVEASPAELPNTEPAVPASSALEPVDDELHQSGTREIAAPIDDSPVAKLELERVTPEITRSDDDSHRIEMHATDMPVVGMPAREMPETVRAALARKAREIKARWMSAHEEEASGIDAPVMEKRESEPAAPASPPVETMRLEASEVDAPRNDALVAAPFEASVQPASASVDAIPAQAGEITVPQLNAPIAGADESAVPPELTLTAHDIEIHQIERGEIDAPEIERTVPTTPERREPTFDPPIADKHAVEAAVPTTAVEAPAAARKIELPRMQTRIETRRIEILRADPQMVGRRPIFPHIKREEWDIPPMVAARNSRAHGGTGWAIGLGALLLLIGITAPAAIWQQGRQASDQDLAMLNATPPAKPAREATGGAPAQPSAEATQATLPEAPQPEAPPPPAAPAVQAANPPAAPAVQAANPPAAPAVQAANPPTALAVQAANLPVAQPEVGAPAPEQQAALSAVRDGGEVNEAPITMPPAPVLDLPSKPKAQPYLATGKVPEAQGHWPVARAFVPDPAMSPAPFLRAPAGATAAVAAFPGASASVAVRPNLMGQLKPQSAAVKSVSNVPQKVVRKPRPQDPRSLDQMFQTLIDTLSEGKPVNPATKPPPPSNRR
jgi:hypothetical protein